MSAYLTHLCFGIKNYKCMDQGEVKDCIKKHRHAYFYGLAGPDFFFYDVFTFQWGQEKAGCVLHGQRTGAFLKNMCLASQKMFGEKKEIAIAYIAGFLCHYEIDAATHPYIYGIIGENSGAKGSGRHFEMEAAFDVYASVSMLGKMPSELKQNQILHLTKVEKQVVSRLYERAYEKTYQDKAKGFLALLPSILHPYKLTKLEMRLAFFCTYLSVSCLHDQYGLFEKLLGFVEKRVLHYPVLSPLYCNDNTYDLSLDDWAEYRNLCENGLLQTLQVMDHFESWCCLNSTKHFESFLEVVGNKSYHSGLTLDE